MNLEGIRSPAGRGSLILIGGTSDSWRTTEPIDRTALELSPRDRPVAFIPAAQCPADYGETFLTTYRRLGASDGYVVPVHDHASARDSDNVDLIRKAGLVYFGGGETTSLLEAMTGTPALAAVFDAYERGAVVVGMSAGAIALCAWGVPQDPAIGLLEGWGWLRETIVSVHHTAGRQQLLERALRDRPGATGIGLAEDAAIVLGPAGSRDVIGTSMPALLRGGAA